MGQNRVELLTPALSEQCSNRLSYWPEYSPLVRCLSSKICTVKLYVNKTVFCKCNSTHLRQNTPHYIIKKREVGEKSLRSKLLSHAFVLGVRL